MFCMLKNKKYILLMFQNITQIVKDKLFFSLFQTENLWHYLAVRKLSLLLITITSNNNGDFYCPNFLHPFGTKNKLESYKIACENKDFWNVIMRSQDTKILEINQNKISDEASFIIYADLECVIQRIDGYKTNPENSSTTKVSEHIPSGFSMSTISWFRSIENKHGVYRGKDCMKKFKWILKRARNGNNFKKKKMKLLKKSSRNHENAKICYICKEKRYEIK